MTRVTPCVLSYTCHGLESRDFRSKLTTPLMLEGM
jgi:hypothetical protein